MEVVAGVASVAELLTITRRILGFFRDVVIEEPKRIEDLKLKSAHASTIINSVENCTLPEESLKPALEKLATHLVTITEVVCRREKLPVPGQWMESVKLRLPKFQKKKEASLSALLGELDTLLRQLQDLLGAETFRNTASICSHLLELQQQQQQQQQLAHGAEAEASSMSPGLQLVTRLDNIYCQSQSFRESCQVRLEIRDLTLKSWILPQPEVVEEDEEEVELEEVHRGRLSRGGIAVKNCTKVRLKIKVAEGEAMRFFYVFCHDHYAPASNHLQLFFPDSQKKNCNLLIRGSRVFPMKSKYSDDPEHIRVDRTNHNPIDAIEQQSIYLLVTDTCLQDGLDRKLTIQDVEERLKSDVQTFVDRFTLDILPPPLTQPY